MGDRKGQRNAVLFGLLLLLGPSAAKAGEAELIIKGLDCLNGKALQVRSMDVSVFDSAKIPELLILSKRFRGAPTPRNDAEVGNYSDLFGNLSIKMRSAPRFARVVRIGNGRYRATVPSNMRVAVAAFLPRESDLDGYAITELQVRPGSNSVILKFSDLLPSCR